MPKQPPIPKAVIDDMNTLFSQTDPETSKPFTIEAVSAKMNLPISTVGKYRQKWEDRKRAEAEMSSVATRPDPATVLEDSLMDIPGLSGTSRDFVIKQVKRNPALLQNPQELYRLLIEGCRLQPYFAQLAMNAVMSANAQSQGLPPPQLLMGPAQAQGPAQAGPWGWPQGPQQQGFFSNPYPAYPSYGMPQYYPQHGLTRDDVAEIVGDTIEKQKERDKLANLGDLVRQAVKEAMPGGQAGDSPMEEVQEPIFDPETGKPRLAPNGDILIRFVRRPTGGGGQQSGNSPMAFLQELKAAGLIGQRDPAIEALTKNMEQLVQLQMQGSKGGDPEMKALLEKIREDNAKTHAELLAEQARRETTEKYSGALEAKDKELRARELEVALARAGTPPDVAVINKALEVIEKTGTKVQENVEKRLEKAEALIGRAIVGPSPPGIPVPPTDEEVQTLIDAADRVQVKIEAPPKMPVVDAPKKEPKNGSAEDASTTTTDIAAE